MTFLKLYLDYMVFGLLGAMSLIMLTLVIERLWFFARVDVGSYQNKHLLNIDLGNNLTTIASIGSNAPYVGLLGTVLGILVAFYDMSQTDKIETGVIILGLAMALKATAAGLVVAIPSIVFYNGLQRKVAVCQQRFDALGAR